MFGNSKLLFILSFSYCLVGSIIFSTYMIRVNLDPSRGLVLSLVLEAEHAAVIVDVELGDAAPAKLDHLVLEIGKKLVQYLKSEPVPDYASSTEKVKTVVAKNFDEVVNDETKDG